MQRRITGSAINRRYLKRWFQYFMLVLLQFSEFSELVEFGDSSENQNFDFQKVYLEVNFETACCDLARLFWKWFLMPNGPEKTLEILVFSFSNRLVFWFSYWCSIEMSTIKSWIFPRTTDVLCTNFSGAMAFYSVPEEDPILVSDTIP